jgi:hypothetical protein
MKTKRSIPLITMFIAAYFIAVPLALADGKYPVRIVDQSMIVFPLSEEQLQVVQVTTFKNSGSEKEKELPLYLPEGYSDLVLRGGLAEEQMKTVEKGIVDLSGLAAGEEKKISVTYVMPMKSDLGRWNVETSYVAESVYVIVPAGVLSFEANGLKTQSDRLEMNGQELRRFTRVDLHPNVPWTLFFRLLAGPQDNGTAAETAAPKEADDNHANEHLTADGKRIYGHEHGAGYGKAVMTLIVTLVALSIALVGLRRDRSKGKRKSQKQDRPWLLTEKEELLKQVGQLEQDYSSALISEETYVSAKSQIRDKLVQIALELRKGLPG